MNNQIHEVSIHVKLNKDDFLSFIHFEEGNQVYEQIKSQFALWDYQLQNIMKPRARYVRKPWNKEEAVYVLVTLGNGIDKTLDDLNQKGEILQAYIINAMADSYLFLTDERLRHLIYENGREEGLGIKKRLEAFHQLAPDYQEEIVKATEAADWGVYVTKGCMLYPQKTMAYILIIDQGECGYPSPHTCDGCGRKNCGYGKNKNTG